MCALFTEESLILLTCENPWESGSLLCGPGEAKNVPLLLGQQLEI